jgi:hypothetical protein
MPIGVPQVTRQLFVTVIACLQCRASGAARPAVAGLHTESGTQDTLFHLALLSKTVTGRGYEI